jgi:hypothetical protein
MSANIGDKLTNVSSGSRPVSTTVSTLRNSGATTLACADLTGWATDTPVHFVTYQIDGQGDIVAGTQADWKGIVSGTNINSLTLTGGTDSGNAVGDIVELLPTAGYGSDLFDALTATLNQTDGTLKTSIVTTTKINDSAVTTAKIADANVTSAKLVEAFFKGRQQADTTNSTVSGMTVQFGWGYRVGDGSTIQLSKTVTFPVAFASAPIVLITPLGYKSGSPAPTSISQFTSAGPSTNPFYVQTSNISASSFSAVLGRSGTTWSTTDYAGFSWIAIGTV